MKKILFQLVSVLIFVLIWWIGSLFASPFLLPSPIDVSKEFISMFNDISWDLLVTVTRIFFGLGLAIAIGLPVGLILGYYRKLYDSLEFLIDFLRSIPPPLLFPLFLLMFGIGNLSKVFPVIFAGSFYILINTMYGVRNIKKLRVESAKVLGISKLGLFWKIILPEAMPHILTGIRITISIALILVIVFEMFVGTNFGLGQRIVDAQLVYEIPLMYALIVLTGVLGYTLNKLFLIYEKRKTHWWGK